MIVQPGSFCGAVGPKATASRTPAHFVGHPGAEKRSFPSGGSAYGMPRKARAPSSTNPRTRPDCVVVSGSFTGTSIDLLSYEHVFVYPDQPDCGCMRWMSASTSSG